MKYIFCEIILSAINNLSVTFNRTNCQRSVIANQFCSIKCVWVLGRAVNDGGGSTNRQISPRQSRREKWRGGWWFPIQGYFIGFCIFPRVYLSHRCTINISGNGAGFDFDGHKFTLQGGKEYKRHKGCDSDCQFCTRYTDRVLEMLRKKRIYSRLWISQLWRVSCLLVNYLLLTVFLSPLTYVSVLATGMSARALNKPEMVRRANHWYWCKKLSLMFTIF